MSTRSPSFATQQAMRRIRAERTLEDAGGEFARLRRRLVPFAGEIIAESSAVRAPAVQMDGWAANYWPDGRPCWITEDGPIPIDNCSPLETM